MIERVIAWSIERRVLVIGAGFLLAAWGVFAISQIPIDAIPDLSERQALVYADWPGQSPQEVEDQVTYPLSVAIRGLRGVRAVRGASDPGYSWLAVILTEDCDDSVVRRELESRLGEVASRLPAGVTPRLAPATAATGQIFWFTVENRTLDLARLRSILDNEVRPQLATVAGVAEVASIGGMILEYQVEVDPARLREKGVTIEAIERAVAASNAAAGAGVVQKANAEFPVRSANWLGAGATGDEASRRRAIVRDLERVPVLRPDGAVVTLSQLAHIVPGPGPRRGVLEKDGVEVVGGVVQMNVGENPRRVTERLKQKTREIEPGLPAGTRIVPFYDRTPLINGAIGTVTGTLVEAMVTATICVLLVLLHVRASLVISLTLPLTALGAFALIWLLRGLGLVNVQINIMSLAGIAISVGVLVDSSVVMTENVMHNLRQQYGDRPVRGDVRDLMLPACRQVGRPALYSVMIMLLSFIPVFCLGGMEGRMFHPLAFTKCLTLLIVAVLTVTFVPALCTFLVKGRMRSETRSPLVRAIIEVYRPVLSYLLDRPAVLAWILGATWIVASATIGVRWILLASLAIALVAFGLTERRGSLRALGMVSLVLISLLAQKYIKPLPRQFMTPLDEGMVMDMPITVPRASVTENLDDLKARDMMLCRFPEVDMVVGKGGRADTPNDPAPLDMIETMVNFRPPELWPRRVLKPSDARGFIEDVYQALRQRDLMRQVGDAARRDRVLRDATASILSRFDVLMREYAYQRNLEFTRSLLVDPARVAIDGPGPDLQRRWREYARRLDAELRPRAAESLARLAIEELLKAFGTSSPDIAEYLRAVQAFREQPAAAHHGGGGHAMSRTASLPASIRPQPELLKLQGELARAFESRILLFRRERSELIGAEGELDRAVAMPGWQNVWTMPIQNRVDMLTTGVNTAVGVRVLGPDLEAVVRTSEDLARLLKRVRGAVDVVADPIRGKGTLEVRVNRDRAARMGISAADVNRAVESAFGGRVATTTVEGRERHTVRVRYGRDWRRDEESMRRVLVPLPAHPGDRTTRFTTLSQVADIEVVEGLATIRSEGGYLRNYVRLNLRNRDASDFVEEARRLVAAQLPVPPGVHLEWTGQFEFEVRARNTLLFVVPLVLVLILAVLYVTYRDLADALTMLMAVPGALAGGLLLQWVAGTPFSVTVWIGYIACFGMATSTSIIMLVYLRDAVERAGGLGAISLEGLRQAVLDGAVHRLRPKLLTEGTTLLGLAPLLWSTGVASDVIRPMAIPVMGGILIADEVIDLLLPIIFYQVRTWRWRRLHTTRQSTAELSRTSHSAG